MFARQLLFDIVRFFASFLQMMSLVEVENCHLYSGLHVTMPVDEKIL